MYKKTYLSFRFMTSRPLHQVKQGIKYTHFILVYMITENVSGIGNGPHAPMPVTHIPSDLRTCGTADDILAWKWSLLPQESMMLRSLRDRLGRRSPRRKEESPANNSPVRPDHIGQLFVSGLFVLRSPSIVVLSILADGHRSKRRADVGQGTSSSSTVKRRGDGAGKKGKAHLYSSTRRSRHTA